MTTLRDAAQAFLDAYRRWTPGVTTIKHVAAAEKDLDAALSLPDPGGWAEGAREGLEAAKAEVRKSIGTFHDFDGPNAKVDGALRAVLRDLDRLPLPVPPATTAPALRARYPEGSEAWLVYGSTGEYSDRTDWYVCAYLGPDAEAKATRHADLAAQRVKAFEALRCPHDEPWTAYCPECADSYLAREGRLTTWMGDLDPDVKRDYTGTDYCALRVEIRSDLPAPVEPEETP